MATTSGTTNFNPDFLEIAEEAWERASGGVTEMRSGYNLRTAQRSLNLLLMDWANRGVNLWTLEEIELPLSQGVESYILPDDTVDLFSHRLKRLSAGDASSTPVSRCSVYEFVSQSRSVHPGVPTQLVIDRQVLNPIVHVWPVPDSNDYVLSCWRVRRMQDAGSGRHVQDVPFRFVPALVAGLAYMVAAKIPEGAARLSVLKMQYDEAWMSASEEDREKAPLRLVPRMRRV